MVRSVFLSNIWVFYTTMTGGVEKVAFSEVLTTFGRSLNTFIYVGKFGGT